MTNSPRGKLTYSNQSCCTFTAYVRQMQFLQSQQDRSQQREQQV